MVIEDYKPPLGFVQLVAVADALKKVHEIHETNNTLTGEKIAVIARTWDVTSFTSTQSLPAATINTATLADFHFQFVKYDVLDESFEYDPVGQLQGTAVESGVCSGSGSNTIATPTGDNDYLAFGAKLTTYGASVDLADQTPYPVHVTCLGGASIDAPFSFQDLKTYVGFRQKPHMSPDQTTLSDSVANPQTHLLFTWTFTARIHH